MGANHAGNMANRKSHSKIVVYVNNLPLIWYSKCHNTFEASIFGLGFVSLSISKEMIESLRYKLRCFWLPVDGSAEVFCENNQLSIILV